MRGMASEFGSNFAILLFAILASVSAADDQPNQPSPGESDLQPVLLSGEHLSSIRPTLQRIAEYDDDCDAES